MKTGFRNKRRATTARQLGDEVSASIMSSALILAAWVGKAYDEFNIRQN
jgi:hypothetical protein